MVKRLQYYLDLAYPVVLRYLPADEVYAASIPDLPGLTVFEDSPTAAYSSLEDAKKEWLTTAYQRKIRIPEPKDSGTQYSGRVTLRLPKNLHRAAAEQALIENVSLNSYLTLAIERGMAQQK